MQDKCHIWGQLAMDANRISSTQDNYEKLYLLFNKFLKRMIVIDIYGWLIRVDKQD